MEGRMGEIKGLNVQAHKAREEQQKLEHQIRELKVMEIKKKKKKKHKHTTVTTISSPFFVPQCWQVVNERYSKELEQMQAKNSKLQQELDQLSSAKEHLALENLRSANQLKVYSPQWLESRTNSVWTQMAKMEPFGFISLIFFFRVHIHHFTAAI